MFIIGTGCELVHVMGSFVGPRVKHKVKYNAKTDVAPKSWEAHLTQYPVILFRRYAEAAGVSKGQWVTSYLLCSTSLCELNDRPIVTFLH